MPDFEPARKRTPNTPNRTQDLNEDRLASNVLRMKAAKKRRNRAANKTARAHRRRNR